MKARIFYSVGKGGVNKREDVITVQIALNQFILSPTPKLKVDGFVGRKTIRAIEEFQRTHTDLRQIDGRIDPHGVTIGRLNGRISFHPVHIYAGTGANAQENIFGNKENEKLIELELKKQGGTDKDLKDLINFYKEIKPEVNIARKGVATTNNVRKLIDFFRSFKDMKDAPGMLWEWFIKLPDAHWRVLFKPGFKPNSPGMQIFKAITEPSSKFSRFLNSLSNAASKAGVVIVAMDVVIACKDGDFGVAAGKIYKFVIGKRVPWASMINALQEFVELLFPELAKNNRFFGFLRSIDPIGLGEKGVDSVVTTICCLFQYIFGDETGSNKKLRALEKRLNKGSTGIFAELADWDFVFRKWGLYDDNENDKQKLMQIRRKYERLSQVNVTSIPAYQKI